MNTIVKLCVTFLLLSSLFFLNVRAQASGDQCKGKVGSFVYDLTNLKAATGGNDVITQDVPGNTYYYRPCQVLQQTECQSDGDPSPAVCQKDTRKIPQYHDCGSFNQVSWAPRSGGDNSGFFMDFKGGEEDRHSDIEFICDGSAAGVGVFSTATPTEFPTHFYHLQYRTKWACPQGGDGGDGGGGGDGGSSGGISGGWIFIIILICLIVIYLIGGVLYNRFRRDLRGWELIPNLAFWAALPGLVWSGHVYVYKKLRGLCGAKYETV